MEKAHPVEAMRWIGANRESILAWMGKAAIEKNHYITSELKVPSLEGTIKADRGDWIIKGTQGTFYPLHPDVFERTYEEIYDTVVCPQESTPEGLW